MGCNMNVGAERQTAVLFVAIGALLCCCQAVQAWETTTEQTEIGEAYARSSSFGRHRSLLSHASKQVSYLAEEETLSNDAARRKLLQGPCGQGASADAVFHCTNAVRTNPSAFRGLASCGDGWMASPRPAYNYNAQLAQAAQYHSQDQANRNSMTHTGSDGSSVGTRAARFGYSYNAIAENVARGQTSALQVVMSWICSPGHRKNILSCSYSDLGVGVAQGGSLFYTQVFGCRGGCGCNAPVTPTVASNPPPPAPVQSTQAPSANPLASSTPPSPSISLQAGARDFLRDFGISLSPPTPTSTPTPATPTPTPTPSIFGAPIFNRRNPFQTTAAPTPTPTSTPTVPTPTTSDIFGRAGRRFGRG